MHLPRPSAVDNSIFLLILSRPQPSPRCSPPHPPSRGSGPLQVLDLVSPKESLLPLSATVIQRGPSSLHQPIVSFWILPNLGLQSPDGRICRGIYPGVFSETAPYLPRVSSHPQRSRERRTTSLSWPRYLGIMDGGPHSSELASDPLFAPCCLLLNWL